MHFPIVKLGMCVLLSGYHTPQLIFILKTATGSFYDHEPLHWIVNFKWNQ